jgi:hypothetical protein
VAKKKRWLRIPELSEDSRRFVEDLQKETDRGAALVGAAFVDNVLESMLRAFFVDDAKVVNELLKPAGAAGTLSARIDLAYCMGLMGKREYKDLGIIRRIRNEFAHLDRPVSFRMQGAKSLCQQLVTPKVLGMEGYSNRDRFITTVVVTAVRLLSTAMPLKHRVVPEDLKVAKVVKA